ncbi:MAG TPA: oligoendopeptidase F [Vicinamibacterales bacterium]|jgi:oligoendopeptidase F|nr:oligoendopeptidase F [Vicinamibacterales bacterium]
MTFRVRTFWTAVCVAVLSLAAVAQERDRAKIPEKFRWDLGDIYRNEAAWRAAKDKLAADIPALGSFRSKLTGSPAALADALDRIYGASQELGRLYSYASLVADQNTRISANQGMRQEMVQVAAAFSAATSYVDPEILKAGKATIEQYVATEPRLKPYRMRLDNVLRRAAHTLSESEERLLADAQPMAGSAGNVFGILANADFPYPTVTLSDGKQVRLDASGYQSTRALPNRADREKVMSAYFKAVGGFSGTFGSTMNAEAQKVLFYAKARRYPTALESELDGPNIPVSVYSRLVEGVNRNLASFHRYLALRKRMMGVSELHYYDLYAPLVASVKLEYTPEDAQKIVLAAVAPLGPDYVATIRRAFDDRWIDLLPNDGKRSGAYSNDVFGVHPYMLINYTGQYNDVSTLAHELGHTMQSYLSDKAQPYPTADYPIFVAEVASTFNEALLNDYLLKQIKDDDARLSILGGYLENIKGTVFRQTQFAEFELRLHQMAQNGQSITGEALAKLYLDITRRYYGHDKGVAVVDDYIAHEWSVVPHFYSDFYVFQYATSFTASEALAAKVKSGDAAATRRYLSFLGAGGSKYPIDLLKDAGVDMTTDEPLNLTIQSMNRVMDEMEKILAAKGR